jgi:hypothetical protein
MKARFFMILGALCLVQFSFGQNEIDALRYSKYNLNGTARYVAMGGAFGALGADLSSISINPAGLAMYRRSEFGFSLGFTGAKSSSVYENNTASNSNFSAGFGNIGMVGSYPTKDEDRPRINFAVAYNKTADFNERISIEGTAANTTLLNVFVDQANGVSTEDIGTSFPFSASLAWDTYLINPSDTLNSGLYTHEIPWGDVTQTKTIERTGSMGETILAGGLNYSDDVYIGVSLGFPSLSFTEESTYREGDLEEGFELDHFVLRDNMVTRGNGFNIKVGGIYKPNDWLRVGAAVHSPNWMTVNESYDRSMTAVFKGEEPYEASSPMGNYQYRIKTPARFITSLAMKGGKFGLISVDYELVDYTSTKLRTSNRVFDEYDFGIENETISQIYKASHNVRIGAEGRIMKSLRIRAGIGYQTSAFKKGVVENTDPTLVYSGGVGFRRKNFYLEAAYSMRNESADYYLYDPNEVNVASLSSRVGQGILSVGFRY